MNWLYFFGLMAFLLVFLVALILKNNELALALLIILAGVYYYANYAKNNTDKEKHQESLKATIEIAKMADSERNNSIKT
jgi:positive regulator of sigma E activity